MLGEAFFDLARLLVGVDVERQALGGRVGADLLEPSAGQARTEWGATPTRTPAARNVSTWPRKSAALPCRKRGMPPRPYAASRSTSSIPASAAASTAARASGRPR